MPALALWVISKSCDLYPGNGLWLSFMPSPSFLSQEAAHHCLPQPYTCLTPGYRSSLPSANHPHPHPGPLDLPSATQGKEALYLAECGPRHFHSPGGFYSSNMKITEPLLPKSHTWAHAISARSFVYHGPGPVGLSSQARVFQGRRGGF